jgi:hypothetical protein
LQKFSWKQTKLLTKTFAQQILHGAHNQFLQLFAFFENKKRRFRSSPHWNDFELHRIPRPVQCPYCLPGFHVTLDLSRSSQEMDCSVFNSSSFIPFVIYSYKYSYIVIPRDTNVPAKFKRFV